MRITLRTIRIVKLSKMVKLSGNRRCRRVNNFLCSNLVEMMYYYIFLCVQTSELDCSF